MITTSQKWGEEAYEFTRERNLTPSKYALPMAQSLALLMTSHPATINRSVEKTVVAPPSANSSAVGRSADATENT